jgi:hypothetical protein
MQDSTLMVQYAVENDLGLPHHVGISEILQHCGPESFQQEPLLTIFKSCRAVLVGTFYLTLGF